METGPLLKEWNTAGKQKQGFYLMGDGGEKDVGHNV